MQLHHMIQNVYLKAMANFQDWFGIRETLKFHMNLINAMEYCIGMLFNQKRRKFCHYNMV